MKETTTTSSVQVSAQPPAKITGGLIKEKKLMNVEHRTPNIEHRIRYSVFLKRLSEAIPSFVNRHSTFVIPM